MPESAWGSGVGDWGAVVICVPGATDSMGTIVALPALSPDPRPPRSLERFGLLRCFFDGADVHESLLGQVVPLALEQLFEAAHGVGHGDVLAGGAGKHLGNKEGLAEEALDAPRARNGELVLIAQRVDPEDGADVL